MLLEFLHRTIIKNIAFAHIRSQGQSARQQALPFPDGRKEGGQAQPRLSLQFGPSARQKSLKSIGPIIKLEYIAEGVKGKTSKGQSARQAAVLKRNAEELQCDSPSPAVKIEARQVLTGDVWIIHFLMICVDCESMIYLSIRKDWSSS